MLKYSSKIAVFSCALGFEDAMSFAIPLGWSCYLVNIHSYSNMEMEISLPKIDYSCTKYNKLIVFVKNNRDANFTLMKAYLIVSKLTSLAKHCKIEVIFTYMPYSRHDASDSANGLSTFDSIITMLYGIGINKIYAIDLHKCVSNELPAIENIPTSSILNDIINKNEISTVIFPDIGAKKRFENCIIGDVQSITCSKIRDGVDGVSLSANLEAILEDKKSCIIVDDVVHSCNTLFSAVKMALPRIGGSLFCFVTHFDVASKSFDYFERELGPLRFYTTNTVANVFESLSVPIEVIPIGEVIKNYFDNYEVQDAV